MFVDHTVESAPAAARRSMEATIRHRGYLPAAVDGFLKISGIFETTTLDPVAREVVIMTIATRNECHLCVAMHTAKLTSLEAAPELVEALREQRPLGDGRLEAIRVFTLDVVAAAGDVGDDRLRAFLAHGYTTQNALEVVLGIGAYTMSTLANRLTKAPIDEELASPVPANG
jgi:AhpD family alkylhydroperoxidase